MPKKLKKCVSKLRRSRSLKSAWAICTKTTGQKAHKKKKH